MTGCCSGGVGEKCAQRRNGVVSDVSEPHQLPQCRCHRTVDRVRSRLRSSQRVDQLAEEVGTAAGQQVEDALLQFRDVGVGRAN